MVTSSLLVLFSIGGCTDAPLESPGLPPPEPPPLPTEGTWLVEDSPAWSPDGATIAYHQAFASRDGPAGLYLIAPDGANKRLLLEQPPDPLGFQEIRFSPDGRTLAFMFRLDIFLVDAETAAVRRLTYTESNARSPDWSPCGNWIAYSRPFGRGADIDSSGIYIVDVKTGQERALFNEGAPVYGGGTRWSPVSDTIAFWSGDRTDGLNVFTILADGTQLRQLTHATWVEQAQYPTWVDRGRQIMFVWIPQDATRPETRIMNGDGSDQRSWPVFLGYHPAISPDFRRFVRSRPRADSLVVLFVQDVDDTRWATLRELTGYAPPTEGARLDR